MESDPPHSVYLSLLPLLAISMLSTGVMGASYFVLLFLLLSSALVSGSEVAFFSLTPDDLRNLEQERNNSAKRILQLKSAPRKLLATILISNNFINIGIVILSDFILLNLLGETLFKQWATQILYTFPWLNISVDFLARALNFIITIVGVTFLLVLFGEVMPKIYARFNNIQLARIMSGPLNVTGKIVGPLSSMLVNWASWMERKFQSASLGSGGNDHKSEIDQAIDLTVSSGSDSKTEVDILKSIIKFSEVSVKQIMQSRVDVVSIDKTIDYSKLLETIKNSGYSRIPVYEEDFDNVIGILYAKDLIGHLDQDEKFKWQELIRKDLLYVPESKRINELLKDFQTKRLHMAIVVDEFGGSSGIVTLEDVMEEVIGEIRDEFDQDEELDYVKLDANNFIFEGKTQLNDVCRVIGMDTRSFDHIRGEADTIAGLMLEILGRIPRQGYEVNRKSFSLKAISVTKRRVEKVKITLNR